MLWECKDGCQVEQPKSAGHPGECEKHGRSYAYTKALARSKPLGSGEARGRRLPLKRGRGFAVTKAQRDKVRGLPCVGCGHGDDFEGDTGVDPAHLWPRGLGGCDSPDCIIPLCRTCHDRLDNPSDAFELHSRLVDRDYWREMAHVVEAHQVSPLTLLRRVTGRRWEPVREAAA